MELTTREIAATQRLSEALLGFVLAVEEGMAERLVARMRAERPAQRTVDRPPMAAPPKAPTPLLNARDAARSLGIGSRTLWSLTAPRGPIPVIRFGTRTCYAVRDLEAAVERLKVKGSDLGSGGK